MHVSAEEAPVLEGVVAAIENDVDGVEGGERVLPLTEPPAGGSGAYRTTVTSRVARRSPADASTA